MTLKRTIAMAMSVAGICATASVYAAPADKSATSDKKVPAGDKSAAAKPAAAKPGAKPAADKPASAASKAPAEPAKTSSGLPTVIDFGADWCAPCKKLAPIFDKVALNYKGKANFIHIDVDKPGKFKNILDKYNPSEFPTLVFQDAKGNGKDIVEKTMSEAELIQHTEALLK